jgi:hypothetical protein
LLLQLYDVSEEAVTVAVAIVRRLRGDCCCCSQCRRREEDVAVAVDADHCQKIEIERA